MSLSLALEQRELEWGIMVCLGQWQQLKLTLPEIELTPWSQTH